MKSLMMLSAAVLALVAAMPAAASAQAGAPAERFVLSGVVAYDDGDGKAWLQEPSITKDQIVVVRRGDSVGPFRVTAILRNRVELQGPGGAIVVPLSNAGGAGVVAAPSPARPAGTTPAASAPSVPLGHPSRREAISSLTRMLQQSGAQPPSGGSGGASGGSAAKQDSNRSLPDFSAPPAAPSTGPAKTIHVGAGDPRRREAIRQLFGPR